MSLNSKLVLLNHTLSQTNKKHQRQKEARTEGEERRGMEKGEEMKRREKRKGIKLRKVSKISTGQ